jgi:SAM-dependent methyltransferase
MTMILLLLVNALAPWKDPRIHNFGNIGAGGFVHSLMAPFATYLIDTVAYKGFDVRQLLFSEDTIDLGCGVGYSTSPYGVGVDASVPMLNVAKALHPNKKFERGLAEKYGHPNMCKRVTLSFIMHEQNSLRRKRILKNAERISRDEIVIMDIHPLYKPSWAMKTGEPYIEDYLQNFHQEVLSLFENFDIMINSTCEDRVQIWTISKVIDA